MNISVSNTKDEMGRKAAEAGSELIQKAISRDGRSSIILATGASQFEMLEHLVHDKKIDWTKVIAFHLDEYIGIPATHKASFRRYLKERFVDQLPDEIGDFHYIRTDDDPQKECERLGRLIQKHPVDVAFIGIGENGHVAFNDPPADFDTEDPYIIVELDEACRNQQMGEGWFATFDDVPEKAVSMSVKQIMKSSAIICTVPDERKAEAVQKAAEGPVTPELPASILQKHPNCHLFLDKESAQNLKNDG